MRGTKQKKWEMIGERKKMEEGRETGGGYGGDKQRRDTRGRYGGLGYEGEEMEEEVMEEDEMKGSQKEEEMDRIVRDS